MEYLLTNKIRAQCDKLRRTDSQKFKMNRKANLAY